MALIPIFDDTDFRHAAKIVICTLGLALALGYYVYGARKLRPRGGILYDFSLIAVAVLSVFAYFEFGWKRFDIYMNPHDVYHYYIGAKYSEEHEYYNLYRAALIADKELGAKYKETRIRNLDDNSFESVKNVLARADEIKGRFTPARWEEFKKDVKYFRDLVPYWKWKHMLSDKGYNAAPVWNATARWIAERSSTSNPTAMSLITYIDLVLLLVMFMFIWAAFGWRAMLLALIFHDVNYFMSFVHIKGAFMRLDWYAASVIAFCLLKMRWNASAGAMMAWAAMSRVFPAIFCFGLGIKLLISLAGYVRRRRPEQSGDAQSFDSRYLKFFVGFGVACVVLFAASTYADGGLHLWKNFVSKIELHNNDISTTRAGFKYIFLWEQSDKAGAFAKYHLQWQAIMAGALLVTALLVARAQAHEALSLGFIPFFFLTAPTFYYFVILMVPFLYFLSRPELPSRTIGLALFFLVSASCFAFGFEVEHGFYFFFVASCALLGLVGYMAFCAVLSSFSRVPLPVDAHSSDAVVVSGSSSRLDEFFSFVTGLVLSLAFLEVSALAYAGATGQPIRQLIDTTAGMFQASPKATTRNILQRVPEEDATGEADPTPPAPEASKTIPPSLFSPPVRLPLEKLNVPTPDATPVSIPSSRKAGETELVFVGDIMMNRGVARSLEQNKRSYNFPFEVAAPMIQAADIAFGNLECPVSGRGEKLATKRYVFNAKPETAAAIKFAGFDIVSLANNHTLDYGPIALDDTIDHVKAQGIEAAGVTMEDTPQEPVIFERNGIRIGFLAYADPVPGYSYAKEFYPFKKRPAKGTPEIISRDIAALRGNVDVLVVSMHWGTEYKPPSKQQVELGHYIIDQGADIVAGHHPHIQQDAQLYKDGLIIYSMGNFVFDQRSRPATRESRLYRAYVTKAGFQHAEFLPMDIPLDVWQPRPKAEAFVRVTATEPPATAEDTPASPEATQSDAGG